ncbi:MAG: DUF3365 domain-containing protein [Polyangiaceae bacterium]|nr:DUF3365 domain-containing protein [Polyangiaceae bacterium]
MRRGDRVHQALPLPGHGAEEALGYLLRGGDDGRRRRGASRRGEPRAEPLKGIARALLASAFIAVGACQGDAEPAPPAEVEPRAEASRPDLEPSSSRDALARANAAADTLASTLRARLVAALQEGGPASAVDVCSTIAPEIARAAAEESNASVGRSSLRLRNPANAAPAWVASWLDATGEGPAAQARGFERVEEGHARVLRPIAVEGPCLLCHGESVAPEVSAIIRERYPSDRATGYELGDLRGALWAEAVVR